MNDPQIMNFFAMLDDYRKTPEFLRRVAGEKRTRGASVTKLKGHNRTIKRVAYMTPEEHEAAKKYWREETRKRKGIVNVRGAYKPKPD